LLDTRAPYQASPDGNGGSPDLAYTRMDSSGGLIMWRAFQIAFLLSPAISDGTSVVTG
jgi:hypothetical protein